MNEFEQCIDEWATRCSEKDAQITSLQTALDAEREKVKGLHEITKVICGHCREPMEIPSKAALQTQLSKLQGLVRANQQAMVDIRDAVLHGRGPLAEMEVDNDVINAVLDIIDDNTPAALDATPTERRKG